MEYKALPFSAVWENGIFNLPVKLVDEYLKLASEYQLKALLYIFRHNGQASTQEIAKALGQTISDTDNLLEFWVEEGIISQDGNVVKQVKSEVKEEKKRESIIVKETISAPTLTPKDIVMHLRESKELQALVNEAQKVLGRTISLAEQAIIINMVNYYGLKPEVVLMILEYYRNEVCQSSFRTSMLWQRIGLTRELIILRLPRRSSARLKKATECGTKLLPLRESGTGSRRLSKEK